MAGITTAMCTDFKKRLMEGAHSFLATVSKTASGVNGAFTLTGLANVTGLVLGMAVSGSNVAAGAVLASIDSGTQVTVSKAHTNTITTASITFTADTFKVALFKVGVAGTYGAATTNYTDMTGNSDETTNSAGTAYTAGGTALTNASPTTSGTTAYVDFADVSWTTASFSTIGCIIYNNYRRGDTATLATSVHDFAGTQTVTAGTFTLVFPTPDASNAILRIA
jgi:hypothetical protein